MDPLFILSSTFSACLKVKDAVQGAKANKYKAERLLERIELMVSQLERLQARPKLLSPATIVVVEDIRSFVEEEVIPVVQRYTTQKYFQKLLQVDSSRAAFADLNSQLSVFVEHLGLALHSDHAEGHQSIMEGIQQLGAQMKERLNKEMQEDHVLDVKMAEQHFAKIEGDIGQIKDILADSFEEQQAQLVSMRRRLSDLQQQQRSGSSVRSVSAADTAHLEAVLRHAIGEISAASSGEEQSRPMGSSGLQWTTSFDTLTIGKEIGRGGFGVVYEGVWQGIDVAIKRLLVPELTPAAHREFQKEMSLMRDLQHPNIVRLYTACVEPPNLVMVMELCHGGSLFRLIHSEDRRLEWGDKVKIIYKMALGMRFLHGCKPVVLHRDFKSLNVLIGENLEPKIADFGLSRVKTETRTRTMSEAGGTIAWTAPETLNGKEYSEKADVYSFAITAWEVCSRAVPWQGKLDPVILRLVCDKGQRPQFPADTPPRLETLLERCWSAEPFQRPDFVTISRKLREILDAITPDVPVSPPMTEQPSSMPTTPVSPEVKPKTQSQPSSQPSIPVSPELKEESPLPRQAVVQESISVSAIEPLHHEPQPQPQPVLQRTVDLGPAAVAPDVPKVEPVVPEKEQKSVALEKYPPPPLSPARLLALQTSAFFPISSGTLKKMTSVFESMQSGLGYLNYILLIFMAPFYLMYSAIILPALLTFVSTLVGLIVVAPVFRFVRRLLATLMNPRCDTDVRGFVSLFPPNEVEDATLWDPHRIFGWIKCDALSSFPALAKTRFFSFLESTLENSLFLFKHLSLLFVVPITVLGFFVAGLLHSVINLIDKIVLSFVYLVGHMTRQAMRAIAVNSSKFHTRTPTGEELEDNKAQVLLELRWYVSFLVGPDTVPMQVMDLAEKLFSSTALFFDDVAFFPLKCLIAVIVHIYVSVLDVPVRTFGIMIYASFGVAGSQLVHPLLKLLGYFGLGYSPRMGRKTDIDDDLDAPWSNAFSEADVVEPASATEYLKMLYSDLYEALPRFGDLLNKMAELLSKIRLLLYPGVVLVSGVASITAGVGLGLPVFFFLPLLPVFRAVRFLLVMFLGYSSSYDPEVVQFPAADLRSERRLIVKHLVMLIRGSLPENTRPKYHGLVFGWIVLYTSSFVGSMLGCFFYLAAFPFIIAAGLAESFFTILVPFTAMGYSIMVPMRPLQHALGGPTAMVMNPYKFARDLNLQPPEHREDGAWKEMEMLIGYVPKWMVSKDMMSLFSSLLKGLYRFFRLFVGLPLAIMVFLVALVSPMIAMVAPLLRVMALLAAIPVSVGMMLIGLLTGYEGVAQIKRFDQPERGGDGKVEMLGQIVVEGDQKVSHTLLRPGRKPLCGTNATTVLVVDGRILTWGGPPLGNQSSAGDEHAGEVAALHNVLISYVEAGCETERDMAVFYAVTDSGQLWYWGSPPGLETKLSPAIVPELAEIAVAKVSQGLNHALILTVDGRVLALNQKNGMQFVEGLSDVVDVAAGRTHNVAVDALGSVWTWGKARTPSVLGHGSRSVGKPRAIDKSYLVGHHVVAVAAANVHTVLLTAEGRLLTMGEGKGGELGHGTRKAEPYPRVVEALHDVKIISMSTVATPESIDAYTLALSGNGRVFVLGGQMATVLNGGQLCYVPVELRLPESARIVAVAADAGLLLTEHGGVIRVIPEKWQQGLSFYTPPPVQVYQGVRGAYRWNAQERTQWLRVRGGLDAKVVDILNHLAPHAAALFGMTAVKLQEGKKLARADAVKVLRVIRVLCLVDGWRVRADVTDAQRREASRGVVPPGVVCLLSRSSELPDILLRPPGIPNLSGPIFKSVGDRVGRDGIGKLLTEEQLAVAMLPIRPGETLIETALESLWFKAIEDEVAAAWD